MPDDLHRHPAVPPARPGSGAVSGAIPGQGPGTGSDGRPHPGAPGDDGPDVVAGSTATVPAFLVLVERARAALADLADSVATGGAYRAHLDAVDDLELVDAVALAHQTESAAHALTSHLVGVLAHRPAMNPDWSSAPCPIPERGCVPDEEVAMRLGITRQAARALVREGVAYGGPLTATGQALTVGSLDVAKARIVVQRLAEEDWEVAQLVEAEVLPTADRRTTTQLRRDIERALTRVDPQYAAGAHRLARTRHRVEHPRALPDGMASILCVLPATDATRIDTVLDTCARSARALGDPRTLAQLRADGLRDLVTAPPWSDSGSDSGSGSDDDAAPRTTDRPARRDGSDHADRRGPRSADGPLDGARHRDTPRTSLDPSTTDRPARHRPVPRAVVHVTVPLDTVLGRDDQPAELHGYGPITAATAREIATEAGALWRRIVTDPLSGTVLDVGHTRYRPPAGLADHVRARDRWCVRPGCSTPAERCELDHTVEFHDPPKGSPPGTTSADNLGPVCTRDHRLKTAGGFTLRQTAPGTFEWTTPAGHRYRVRPGADRADEHLTRRARIVDSGKAPVARLRSGTDDGTGAGYSAGTDDGTGVADSTGAGDSVGTNAVEGPPGSCRADRARPRLPEIEAGSASSAPSSEQDEDSPPF